MNRLIPLIVGDDYHFKVDNLPLGNCGYQVFQSVLSGPVDLSFERGWWVGYHA